MQDLLSQDEIDALLHGVGGGEIELGPEKRLHEFQHYDLTSQDRIVRGRMPSLERVNERFTRHLRSGFRGLLRCGLDITYEGIQIQKFGEYASTLLIPTSINVVRLDPLPGYGLVVMDARLVFLLVDNFFGGGRFHAKIEGREFTPAETLVVGRVLETIFTELRKAWGEASLLGVQLLQKETTPEAAGVFSANDIAVVSSFSVEFDIGGGYLHLVLPYGMVEPIKTLLDRSAIADADSRANRWEMALKENIQDAQVDLVCRIAETMVSLREVIDLEVGDVIPIDEPKPILGVADIALFNVGLGALKSNLALQVRDKIEHPD